MPFPAFKQLEVSVSVKPVMQHDTVEKTILQGKDPPGTDEEQGTAPSAEHKGVIPPPPVGDEGIPTRPKP